jgi:hypothetical protein
MPLIYRHEQPSTSPLSALLGSAAGLSASVVTRLTRQWQDEARAFAQRRLEDRDYVRGWDSFGADRPAGAWWGREPRGWAGPPPTF